MTDRASGRQLMVLDDAETIACQSRRQAVLHRRRRRGLQRVAVLSLVAAVGAVLAGISMAIVGVVSLALAVLLGLAHYHSRGRRQHIQRVRSRLSPGPGIGAPRPKGGFSTTRHRAGGPIWIDNRAA